MALTRGVALGAPFQIRAGDPRIPALLALLQDSFAFMEGRIDPPSSLHRLTVDGIRAQCVAGEVWALGSPLAACMFLTEKKDALYIGKLAVAAPMRGTGLARRLIDCAQSRARTKGLTRLELETRIELAENHQTFARLGFAKTGEGAHTGFDRPTYIIMQKPLSAL